MKRMIFAAAVAASLMCAVSCHRDGKKTDAGAEEQIDTVMTDNKWKSVDPLEINMNPVRSFAKDWMALAVGNEKSYNSMTIAWGAIGQLWNKPVVIVFVSEDRYTKHLMDENDYFTVTGFPDTKACRDALIYIGTHSQKDEPDKTANAGLHVEFTPSGNPVFAEGTFCIECKKIYSDEFDLSMVPAEVAEGMYSQMGVHSYYIGEITGSWKKN